MRHRTPACLKSFNESESILTTSNTSRDVDQKVGENDSRRGLDWSIHGEAKALRILPLWLSGVLARGGADRGADRGEPVVTIGLGAFGDAEEFCLQCEGDWPGDAFADLDVIDGTDGRDFDSRAHEENFIHDVEHLARNHLFLTGNMQIFSDLHDGVAGDARKNAGGQRRSEECAIVNEENVHARAFANVAIGVESNAFGVAVEGR